MNNHMELNAFLNCVQRIELSGQRKEKLIDDIYQKKSTYHQKSRMLYWKKWGTFAAVMTVMILVGVPVCAKVQSLLRERMEQIPKQELEQITGQLDAQHTETDSYSREYSKQEDEMMNRLEKEYREGRFPKEKVVQITSLEELDTSKVCYLTTTGCFYLPERELTEEEVLEILDFQYTQGYALGERYQEMYADEIREEQNRQKEDVEKLKGKGGIDTAAAEKIGMEWMDKLYPGEQETMEHNTYLYSSEQNPMPDSQQTIKYQNIYMSYIGSMHVFNYFYIDADSGTLTGFEHSDSHISEHETTEEETKAGMKKLLKQAKEDLQNMFGISDYQKILAAYYLDEGKNNNSGSILYHFVAEDGTDYLLKYHLDTQELYGYCDTYYEEYMELSKQADEFLKKMKKDDYVERTLYIEELE